MDVEVASAAPERRRPPAAGIGKKKGTKNRVTREGRAAFRMLLETNQQKIRRALDRVYRKNPAEYVRLHLAMAEFCIPKLQRTEHVLPPTDPLQASTLHTDPQEVLRSYMEMITVVVVEKVAVVPALEDHSAETAPPVAVESQPL